MRWFCRISADHIVTMTPTMTMFAGRAINARNSQNGCGQQCNKHILAGACPILSHFSGHMARNQLVNCQVGWTWPPLVTRMAQQMQPRITRCHRWSFVVPATQFLWGTSYVQSHILMDRSLNATDITYDGCMVSGFCHADPCFGYCRWFATYCCSRVKIGYVHFNCEDLYLEAPGMARDRPFLWQNWGTWLHDGWWLQTQQHSSTMGYR